MRSETFSFRKWQMNLELKDDQALTKGRGILEKCEVFSFSRNIRNFCFLDSSWWIYMRNVQFNFRDSNFVKMVKIT